MHENQRKFWKLVLINGTIFLILFSLLFASDPFAKSLTNPVHINFSFTTCKANTIRMTNGGTDWTNMNPTTTPPRRCTSPLVYDSESDRVILFSGMTPYYDYYNDTWAYDFNSNTWTNMSPSTLPAGRDGHNIAYDVESDRVILFSGYKYGASFSDMYMWQDTWAYDFNSNSWTNMSPSVMPAGRWGPGMAYDIESDRTILFGGFTDGSIPNSETWAYDYNTNTWTNMNPSTHPSARLASPMAYDAESDRVIMFGGWTGVTGNAEKCMAETWAYDYNSNTWTQMNPTSHPIANSANLAYDAESDLVISFGGGIDYGESKVTSDTWTYDFNTDTWTDMNSATHPSARFRACFAYDEQSDQTILFGGFDIPHYSTAFDDTWAYNYQHNPPSAPQNLQGTYVGNEAQLTWETPSTNAGSAITGYNIYRGTTSGALSLLTDLGVVLAYADTNVSVGTTYYYTVTAENAIGEGSQSDEVTIVIPPPIPGFSVIAIFIGAFSALSVSLIQRKKIRKP